MVKRRTSPACQYCDGDCCKAINIVAQPGDRMKQLLGVHYGRDPGDIESVQIAIMHRCMHLGNQAKCTLYHEDPEKDRRPPYCQEYLCEKAQKPGVMILEVQG